MYQRWTRWFLFLVVSMGPSCKIFDGNSSKFSTIDVDQKHPNDRRVMKAIRLANHLDVLLISDPDLNQSAAAMDVGVGSLSDSADHAGIAHFLEHVLFLGTEKYPEPDEYSQYLQSYQGHSNAYTSSENTNYFFEVNHDGFEGALDRFSQFFVAPLFSADFIERERNAVHSEHQKNLKDDGWRLNMLLRHLHRQDHPRRRFATGDNQTLKNTTREHLIAFYNKYYSADVMKLTIMAKEPMPVLEALAKEKFSGIPNHNRGILTFDSDQFDDNDLPRIISVLPIKDVNRLRLAFETPSTDTYWKSKPHILVSHLIGYEGSGSLLSALKEERLVTSLASGVHSETYGGIFYIDMDLTDVGVSKYERVLELFFAYVALLKESKLPRYIYDERKMMADIDFVYREPREGGNVASYYASHMHLHPGEHIDKNEQLFHEFSPDEYLAFVNTLDPKKMNAVLMHSKLDPDRLDQVERYYQTKYRVDKVASPVLAALENTSPDNSLTLPDPNPFIPERLELLSAGPNEKPRKVIDDEWGDFWFEQDNQFFLPKAVVRLHLLNDLANSSPKNKTLAFLYQLALKESHNEWNYDISLAGINYSVGWFERGTSLEFFGYSERLPLLMTEVAKKLTDISISEEAFENLKTDFKKSIANNSYDAAYIQAIYELRYIMSKRAIHRSQIYDPDSKIDLISPVTLEDVKQFADKLFSEAAIEGLAYGSVEESVVTEAVRNYAAILGAKKLPEARRQRSEVFKLAKGQQLASVLGTKTNNHSFVMGVQFGKRDFALEAAMRLGIAHLQGRFYTELRTKQQLGYIVHAALDPADKVLGALFLVQSSKYAPTQISDRVRAFFKLALDELEKMTQEEFDVYRNAVAVELREKNKTMFDRHRELFAEVYHYDEIFGYKEQTAKSVESLTREDVVKVFRKAFEDETRASLGVYLSKADDSLSKPKEATIRDISLFKDTMSVY